MLSKRNFAMMMTMVLVVLVLFLSSPVLKEFFNDYDENHAAKTELIEKKSGTESDQTAKKQVLYFGTINNGYYRVMKEWAGYRKLSMEVLSSFQGANEAMWKNAYVLIDGELLEKNTENTTKILSRYVQRGGVVIFYRLPSYQTIRDCEVLRELLGIQQLRGESVSLHEIRIYSGFLLGGETCYSFEGVEDTEVIDLEREIPWYDISSRTKSYMVGFVSAAEKASMNLNNEDMPAILWRSSLGTGSVFAVNGDYMKGEAAIGMLDAMVYETEEYALYPVVNAQNLNVTGFPDLTVENEEALAQAYGMNSQQFCRDVLWPSLVAGAQKGDWKLTSFLSVKQSDQTTNTPNEKDYIDYLKYFNEESAEAGICLGRIGSTSLSRSVKDERDTLSKWNTGYVFSGGYVRKENKRKLSLILDGRGQMNYFQDIRTVVGEYENDVQILSWMTDNITYQQLTADAYRHTYQDSLRLKSLETALGYSNIQVDMYKVLWPKGEEDEWQKVAEKMAAHIDTYWNPFAAFERTTISESDRRVRNFLNGSVESTRAGDCISIAAKDFTGEFYLLLRTHGEILQEMTGGTFKKVEEDTYLLQLTSEEASVTLRSKLAPYYH